ncbi:D-family protein [Aphelenchoides besseyi]|nr:D-family protein [Aphelenchoides besseyi]
MSMISFANKVAVITGAGTGLGKNYALELARRQASVVVNDWGSDIHGSSQFPDVRSADFVVDEIRANGGKAVANYDNVLNGKEIIQTAIEKFGRVDILINNAGILRDVTFSKMTEDDWKAVLKVHVQGAFNVTKAAWKQMVKQKYGRLIFTSSNSGIYGNYGQCNYAAAKSAVIGLSNSLALEGHKFGIMSNVIVPSASTRLSDTILSPEQREALKPEYITPMVTYLCSSDCRETGKVFEAGGSHFGQIKTYRTRGLVISNPTAETVRDGWSAITDQEDPLSYNSFVDATQAAIKAGLESLGIADRPLKK